MPIKTEHLVLDKSGISKIPKHSNIQSKDVQIKSQITQVTKQTISKNDPSSITTTATTVSTIDSVIEPSKKETDSQKSNSKTIPPTLDLNDLKREAITITSNIVEIAKNELSKQQRAPIQKKLSMEISDEDMVEKDDHELEAIKEKLKTVDSNKNESTLNQSKLTDSKSSTLPKGYKPSMKVSPSREEMMKEMKSSSSSSQPLSEYRTPSSSRPQSSEFDMTIIQETPTSGSHIGSSEYVTCPMTRDSSFQTVPTSQDTSQYFTPPSGKTNSPSIETGSSSNLGEISEASETIVGDDEQLTSRSDDEANYYDEQYQKINKIDTSNVEPFNYEITSSMLKGDEWQILSSNQQEQQKRQAESDQAFADDPFEQENMDQIYESSPYKSTTTNTATTTSSPLEILDKNLYTLEEENEDSFNGRKLAHQISPKNITLRTETTETSSTSSSLREFERLESEVVKELPLDTSTVRQTAEFTKLSGTVGPDNISLYEQEDQSLNSELSLDTVTCIRVASSQQQQNQPQRQEESNQQNLTGTVVDSGPQSIQAIQNISNREQNYFAGFEPTDSVQQTDQLDCSLDPNFNPILDCDFSSIGPSSLNVSVDSTGLVLHCDEQLHPALTASQITDDQEVDSESGDGDTSRITDTTTTVETRIEHN